jgi:hypothetical protein
MTTKRKIEKIFKLNYTWFDYVVGCYVFEYEGHKKNW